MEYKYDVAISFAGENRIIAEEIAEKLKHNNVKVFYDKYEEAALLGEDIYEHFSDVYSKKARFCMMLISRYYAEKIWTRHERKSAQERALNESSAYILPVRLDNTPIPGIRDTVGYFDLQSRTVDELISIVLQKLGLKKEQEEYAKGVITQSPLFSIPLPKMRRVFTQRDKDRFNEDSFSFIKKYFNQGIKEINKMDNIDADFLDINLHRFSCKLYGNGKRISECTIWLGSSMSSESSICYSNQASQETNSSMNDILSIEVNDDALTFKALLTWGSQQKSSNLSSEEAAKYLWTKLVEPLGR